MEIRAFLNSDSEVIPRTQGLYAFYLDIINPVKLGLLGPGAFSDKQLNNARMLLVNRCQNMITFLRDAKFHGEIEETGKRTHMASRYSIKAQELNGPALNILKMIEEIPNDQLCQYIGLAKNLALFTQPIYVGITKKQTLQDRYFQHKYDFENGTDMSKFGVRLKNSDFRWDEVIFSCIEFKSSEDNMQLLGTLEVHLQTISRPVLSIS